MADEVVVLNEGLQSRTLKSGKQRFHVKVTAEPILINTDAKALGAPIAQAIAHSLREKMRAIGVAAAPATLRARQQAAEAFAAGKTWAMRRYAGGRMGPRTPNQSTRAFNDSGRFAESIVAQPARDNSWRVNVAANRLDPSTAGGVAGVERIWSRLLELVPEFGDIRKLLESDQVLAARIQTAQRMISKGRATAGKVSTLDVARAVGGLLRQVADIGRSLAG